jgi:outer membrane protein TolC
VLLFLSCGSAVAQLGGGGLVTASSTQNPFFGGVTSGTATAETLDLSLRDALDRGLRFNLGLLLSTQSTAQVRATRLSSLANLLPSVNGHVAETEQQINLAALGVSESFLRGASPIVGPFPVFDTRATLTEAISLRALNRLHADTENLRAADFNLRNARDLVVLFVGGGYIQSLSAQSRIEAIQAQVVTAQSLYQQAVDMKKAGTIAAIDVLRAQTELQIQQQRLVAAKNDFEKAKLQLAHAIGMPQAQQYRLTSAAPYQPVPPITLDQALDRAFRSRSDYQSALVLKRSAELTRKAAVSTRLPSLQFNCRILFHRSQQSNATL